MKTFWESLVELLQVHKGKFIGGTIGFVIALLMLIIGFWRTLLIILLVLAGITIGSQTDDQAKRDRWLARFFGSGKE